MAKLSTLKLTDRAQAGAVCVIRDFTASKLGEDGKLPPLFAVDGTPTTITMLGIDAHGAQDVRRKKAADQQNLLYQSLYAKDEKPDGGLVSPEDIAAQEEAEVLWLASLTVSWHGFEDDDDNPVICTPETAAMLYRSCPPIRAQVSAFVNDRASFFGPLGTRSAPTSLTISA